MNLQAQTALFAAFITLAAGLAVIMRRRRTRAWISFALLNFTLFVWQVSTFLRDVAEETLYYRLALAAAALVPAASFGFFRAFLERRDALTRNLVLGSLVIGGLLLAGSVSPLGDKRVYHLLVGVYVFPALYACTAMAWWARRSEASAVASTRLLYLFVGGVLVVSLNLLDVLARAGIRVPPLGNVGVLVYIYFLSQMLFRYRLVDLQDLVAKGLVVGVLAVLLTVIFSVLTVWVGGDRPGMFFFNALVASVVILLLFAPMRDAIETRTRTLFFPRAAALTELASNLENRVATAVEPRDIAGVLVSGFCSLDRVTAVSVYLLDEDAEAFERLGYHGEPPAARIELLRHRALADGLRSHAPALLRETLERELEEGEDLPIEEREHRERVLSSLSDMQASACFPMRVGDEVTGLLNLDDSARAEAYAQDEIEAIARLAQRAALAAETTRLFERREERQRMASLGEMAASLAHEIRNPLGAIKGAAQYLDRAAEEQDREFLGIIVEEADRLNGVVEKFLDYARPYSVEPQSTEVNRLVERSIEIAHADLPEGITLEFRPGADLPDVPADAERLHQVFLNLIRNAAEALEQNGRIWVSTGRQRSVPAALLSALRPGREPGGKVEIRVWDNGPGIPAANRTKVFTPFFTTKEQGTGLGLAISRRIVEAHDGDLLLRGRPGRKGALFVVRLPVVASRGTLS